MSSALERFRKEMLERCTIKRATQSSAANMDLVLSEPFIVAAGVLGLIVSVSADDPAMALGYAPLDLRRGFFDRALDIRARDIVVDGSGVEWSVTDPPVLYYKRGHEFHHIEVVLLRRVIA